MSYCVECGVKLAESQQKCPLCHTPVVNPNLPPDHAPQSPWPEAEEPALKLDRGYAAQLSIMAVLIPMLAVLLLDILDGRGLWSPYAMGALALLWVYIAVPLVFRFKRPYPYVALDAAATVGYLWLVASLSGGMGWYRGIVMPMLVLLGAATLLMLLAWRRVQMPLLYRLAAMALVLGASLIAVEVILDLNARGRVMIGWSLYAAITVAVVALMLAGLEHNHTLKDEIRRRLFI
ncbi:MAG TPA: RING finger protein [Candidatus Limnocylindria bacterium]|nr:RING finger protein [Candidatus Limnocylindria bacterium]